MPAMAAVTCVANIKQVAESAREAKCRVIRQYIEAMAQLLVTK